LAYSIFLVKFQEMSTHHCNEKNAIFQFWWHKNKFDSQVFKVMVLVAVQFIIGFYHIATYFIYHNANSFSWI